MGKPFKDLDEQIGKLRGRKLVIDDEKLVKKQLLTNTYYNTVNSYGYLLRDSSGSGDFIKGATFKELFHLYSFDKEIKNTFFRSIVIIESSFKSIIAYDFCDEFRDDYSYLHSNKFKDSTDEITKSVRLINKLAKIIKENRHNDPVKHYCDNHKNVPLWVLVKKMDFGTSCHFYDRMKDRTRNTIAKTIGNLAKENHNNQNYSLTSEQVYNYMLLVKDVRNIVAHNERLLNYKSRLNTSYHKTLHHEYNINNPSSQRNDVYNVFIVMKLFLTNEQFINLNNSIRRKIIKKGAYAFNGYYLHKNKKGVDSKGRKCHFVALYNTQGSTLLGYIPIYPSDIVQETQRSSKVYPKI